MTIVVELFASMISANVNRNVWLDTTPIFDVLNVSVTFVRFAARPRFNSGQNGSPKDQIRIATMIAAPQNAYELIKRVNSFFFIF